MLRNGWVVLCAAMGLSLLGIGCSGEEEFTLEPTAVGGGGHGGEGNEGGGGAGGMGGVGGAGGMGGSGGPVCNDADMDGVTDCDGDCDDMDASSYPGAIEICGDGVDNDCDMTADQPAICQGGIGTYVSDEVGDDATGTGTKQNPVATIDQGIVNALTIGNGQPVFVAEGDYDGSVIVVEGVSLLGGYQCDSIACTWTRDPDTYIAAVNADNREGSLADISVTNATLIEGLTFVGFGVQNDGSGATPGTSAFTARGGTPILRHDVFQGATESLCNANCGTRALRVVGPTNDFVNGLQVQDSRLLGGTSNRESTALILEGNPAPIVKVFDSFIKGGTGSPSRAVGAFAASGGTEIRRSQINAGSAPSGTTAVALFIAGYITIDGNWINADAAEVGSCGNPGSSAYCGGIESSGATATITNNVIYGLSSSSNSAAINMGDGETVFGLLVIANNTMDGGPVGNSGSTPTRSAAMTCRTTAGTNAKIGRIRNNILLSGIGGTTYGFYEQDQSGARTCAPLVYQNNAFAAAFTAAHRQWTAGGAQNLLATFAEVNMQTYAASNTGDAPSLDATWHLMPGSLMIDQGTSADAPALDIDTDMRPQGAGIDIGADEGG